MLTESGMRNLWKHVFEQHVISRASVQSLTIHFPSLSQIFWFPLHSNFVAPGAWNCRRRKRSTSLWPNRFNCLRNRQERQNHGHLDGAAFCFKMYFAKRRLSVVVKHKMLQICYWVTGVPGCTGIHQFLSWKSKHPTSCCLTYSAAEAQVLRSDTSGTFRCPPEPSLPTSRPRQHMIGKHCLEFLSSVAVGKNESTCFADVMATSQIAHWRLIGVVLAFAESIVLNPSMGLLWFIALQKSFLPHFHAPPTANKEGNLFLQHGGRIKRQVQEPEALTRCTCANLLWQRLSF